MKDGRLEVSDLMIGDLVDVRCDAAPNTPHIERITPAHFLRDEIWLPIPITPEILEKNGFKLDKEDGWWWLTPKIGITFWEEGNIELEAWNEHTAVNIHIKYLHQLQHALRLCGITLNIDKKIEL